MSGRRWRDFDLWLLLATACVVALGVALIYSATFSSQVSEPLQERSYFRQAMFGLSGLVFVLLVAAIDYRWLGHGQWLIYAATLGMLILVRLQGKAGFGAQSWLSARGGVQPSELAKVLLIVVLAKFLADHEEHLANPVWLLTSLAILALPVYLVYKQPDLGTAIVLVALWLGLIFVAGTRPTHLVLLAAGLAATAPVLWFSMKGYMKERVLVFLNPASDVSGISYNTNQALISIGSGGWFGKGLLHGTQSQLYFLRVRHTDYVFSVLCEELGFVGALALLGLLAFILWRILRAARLARDSFGRLIACGVAVMIFFQSAVNIAVNVGLMPVTGLTLPLVSYGGSSLWTTLLGIGLVESVVMRHRRLDFAE
ncbi:MAG: Rod shape-determining protein RodA [Chloroflexi bacterium ADurb.Bin180]|nr:MAG: Rod shape-determining protein RodA [Chloroflexi bacterium ADurb.Bin180]